MCRAVENLEADKPNSQNKSKTFPIAHVELKPTNQTSLRLPAIFALMSCKTVPARQPMQSIQCVFRQTATRLLTSKSLTLKEICSVAVLVGFCLGSVHVAAFFLGGGDKDKCCNHHKVSRMPCFNYFKL